MREDSLEKKTQKRADSRDRQDEEKRGKRLQGYEWTGGAG